MVRAGYIEYESKKVTDTHVGVPQGGIISPLLSNLILHELDVFVENLIGAEAQKQLGKSPSMRNPLYTSLTGKISYINRKIRLGLCPPKDWIKRETVIKDRRKTPEQIPNPDFLKMKYVRYADD